MSKKPAPPSKGNDGAGGGKDDAGAAAAAATAPDPQSLPPDPTVMLYLQAAAAAFPRVQYLLQKQASAVQKVTHANKTITTKLEAQITSWVRKHVDERKEMALDLETLTLRKGELEKQLVEQKNDFDRTRSEHEVEHATTLTTLREQIAVLQANATEASSWLQCRNGDLFALETIYSKLETLKEAQGHEVAALTEENEAERRKLRDLLVRKLRRVRDIMSSTTDDDADGGGGGQGGDAEHSVTHHHGWRGGAHGMMAKDAEAAAMISMFQTPTAKLNEKLSRAVTMYERESRTIAESIATIHVSTKASHGLLEEQRVQNEKLVLRNASQSKAKLMLISQLEELKEKYNRLNETHETQEVQRRRALQETVRMQSDVVADLKGELQHNLNEYEAAVQELSSLERQLKQKRNDANEARRFFSSIASFQHALAPDALSHSEAPPPSGFVGDNPGSSGTKEPQQQHRIMSFTEMAQHDIPGIPMLNLQDPQDVAWFLAGVVQRGTA